MGKYIFKKIMYGILVTFGVITCVFFMFNLKPVEPERMLGGQNANAETLKEIRKDLGLDLPLMSQYLLYLNDLMPLSIHKTTNTKSHIFLDTTKYSFVKLFSVGGEKVLVLKYPYLRRSFRNKELVSDIIFKSMSGTIVLAVASILLASIFGITMGIIAAMNKGGFFDSFTQVVAILGISGPSYFIGLIVAWLGGFLWSESTTLPILPVYAFCVGILFGIVFNKYHAKKYFQHFSISYVFIKGLQFMGISLLIWLICFGINGLAGYDLLPLINNYFSLPGTGLEMAGSLYDFNEITFEKELRSDHLILPTIALGIRPLAIFMQLTRSSLLDVISQDYIRTARAKGLSNVGVVVKHALKNALNPVITAISGWFASLLAGAVFIEYIFGWDGIGSKVYEAVTYNDVPLVIGSVLVVSSIFVLLNIIVDVLYAILDPRIRVKA